jgi:hypothetical protein
MPLLLPFSTTAFGAGLGLTGRRYSSLIPGLRAPTAALNSVAVLLWPLLDGLDGLDGSGNAMSDSLFLSLRGEGDFCGDVNDMIGIRLSGVLRPFSRAIRLDGRESTGVVGRVGACSVSVSSDVCLDIRSGELAIEGNVEGRDGVVRRGKRLVPLVFGCGLDGELNEKGLAGEEWLLFCRADANNTLGLLSA